jgi:hypothetical protein
VNTHRHINEPRPRRRPPLQLGPIPRPDPSLPEGYSVEEITGLGYRFVVDVDAVTAGRC